MVGVTSRRLIALLGLIADQGAAPDFTGYGIEVTTLSTARSETVVSLCAHA
jgi:hypothetical protein